MEFRIADTFHDSMARLNRDEQKGVKLTAFDLQTNLTNPGLNLHRIERSKDKNFWTARVNSDLRVVLHKKGDSLLLCYVDHHDKAYEWAERRKVEFHPEAGTTELITFHETVQEVVTTRYIETEVIVKPRVQLDHVSDEELLKYGVPADRLHEIRKLTVDEFLDTILELPCAFHEALCELADGGTPRQKITAALILRTVCLKPAVFHVSTMWERLQGSIDQPIEPGADCCRYDQQRWVIVIWMLTLMSVIARSEPAQVLATTWNRCFILANVLRELIRSVAKEIQASFHFAVRVWRAIHA